MSEPQACINTDKEIWRRIPGDFYSPCIHVTQSGDIGIDVGGTVIVAPVEDWHKALFMKIQDAKIDAHVSQQEVEPDMTHMGDKHIKPCRGARCSELILWAKHVKKDGSIGNVAPLVKAKEGEKPNIAAWYDEEADQWFYEINGIRDPEYLNHHSNCNSKGQFKTVPVSEDEQRQAEIK